MSKEQHLPATTHLRLSLLHRRLHRHGHHRRIQPATACGLLDDLGHLGRVRRQSLPRAVAARHFPAGCHEIGRHNLHTSGRQQTSEHQPDWSLAGHHHRVARQQVQAVYRLKHRVHRLQHRPLEKTVFSRNLHQPRQTKPHDPYILRVPAAGRLETRRDARAQILGALSIGTVPTSVAIQAGHMMMQRHTIAHAPAFHPRANLHQRAGSFMPKNARSGHGAVLNFFYIRRTHPAGGHLHQDLVRAAARYGHSFHAQIIHTAIHHGLHCAWDGVNRHTAPPPLHRRSQ